MLALPVTMICRPVAAMLLLVGLLQPIAALRAPAHADTTLPSPREAPVSPSERREQLAKLNEGLNSPDPLKRLANLDFVLRGNDRLAHELAIQSALGSSDATMRSYAALLILSTTQLMNLELSMPPDLQSALDKAGDDAEAQAKTRNTHVWLFNFLAGDGSHATFQIHDFNADTGQFKVTCEGDPKGSPTSVGQLNGGSLAFRAVCMFPGLYQGDCAAALQLGARGVFTGTLSCVGVTRPMPATLRLH